MSDRTCVRAGCFHPESEHTEGDGCTRQIPHVLCACAAFVADRATITGSDGAPGTPEAHATAPPAIDARSDARATPATRERLPDERASYTKEFCLKYSHKDGSTDEMRFYFTASVFDDGRVGEIFIRADKTGTLVSGALDAVAMLMSLLLQHGIPLELVVGKLRGTRFPPANFTGDKDIPNCSSPLDLLARWLEFRFLPRAP